MIVPGPAGRLANRSPLLAAIVALAIVAGCGPGGPVTNPYAPRTAAPSAPQTAAATLEASATIPESPVEGVVTVVDTEGLDKVLSFTIRTEGGASWEFEIRTLQNAAEFPPSHLVEHKATLDPVRVHFRLDGSVLVADRIEDAG